jgi:CBS domain-containing protein
MKVEKLMTKDVSTCCPDDTLNEAARIMWERDCGFVPITQSDGSGRVLGIVTDRDICIAAYTRGTSLKEIRVGDVMSKGVQSCQPNDDLVSAEGLMRRSKIHRLPVVDDAGMLVGVISLADIAREAAREGGSRRREVTAAEIGETLAAIREPRSIRASSA